MFCKNDDNKSLRVNLVNTFVFLEDFIVITLTDYERIIEKRKGAWPSFFGQSPLWQVLHLSPKDLVHFQKKKLLAPTLTIT